MENRPISFEPHIFKDNYKAQAYILSPAIGIPIINRLYKVKRLTDNSIIEKGKTVIIEGERYRILRFLDFHDDLGIECRSIANKRLFKEIRCLDCTPENIEI